MAAAPPKRFKGDGHACVAMIFRPIVHHRNPVNGVNKQSEEEQVEDVPIPVTILPKERCEEDHGADVEPMAFAYDDTYWSTMRELLQGCEVFYILRATNRRDRWSGQVSLAISN